MRSLGNMKPSLFQSTLPRGERQNAFSKIARCLTISIHAPARGATFSISPFDVAAKFQSTLPRGERRCSTIIPGKHTVISIHAPARGATFGTAAVALFIAISIHAPARGATFRSSWNVRSVQISIHAPARGATKVFRCCWHKF